MDSAAGYDLYDREKFVSGMIQGHIPPILNILRDYFNCWKFILCSVQKGSSAVVYFGT